MTVAQLVKGLNAIFVGTLAEGFKLAAVEKGAAARRVATQLRKNGNWAEALPVINPKEADKMYEGDACGNVYLAIENSLLVPPTIYGPFPTEDLADEFFECNRHDGQERSIFELNS